MARNNVATERKASPRRSGVAAGPAGGSFVAGYPFVR
jgi:hypothetical protein